MALSPEWQRRVERWLDVLWSLCYRPLETIPLSGFTTMEQLTSEQALAREFAPMPPGTRWGAKWEYGWFKGECILPQACGGQRVVLCVDVGGEALVWIDGQIAGARDREHTEITLALSGQPGARYSILMEAYAGHGLLNVGTGPVPFGAESVPEPGMAQAVMGESTFGVWLEEVYQLAIDWSTLYELHKHLDPLCLRVAEIAQALMDATMIVDVELPEAEMLETVRAGRARLRPLLECVNGSTMPTLFAFGHAHLDVAWLWPLAETERKNACTAANQLALMAEYPEYKYLQSQPHLYHMLKTRYPDLYARFKGAVGLGQVIADGAMWIEADTNLTSGESLIRQIMYGRRFFREEFGVDSRVLWLPDVFGYSGALPQILRGCGISGFATQKITWTYNGGDPFPYNTFLWEGIDGATIPAHIFTDYNSRTRPDALLERWNTRLQKNGISTTLLAFGWGDGGGGPTRDHMEYLRRVTDLEGVPRVKLSSPAEFFHDLERRGLPRERYVGELYFQAHRGTYTSQAKTKQGNRRSEFALREAELWATAARALNAFGFSPRTLDETWRAVLLNQFHDILPGSSIHRVYEEAEAAYTRVIETASKVARDAACTFTDSSNAVTVFNSLCWPRTVLVELPGGHAEVDVPACGWKTVAPSPYPDGAEGASALNHTLENEFLRAEFDEHGEIVRLLDKETGRDVLAGPGNRFLLFKDVPTRWDAWDIESMAEQSPVELNEPVTLEVISSGPLIAQLRLTRKLHHSTLTQVISLRRGARRIEFATTVDWQERHKLLKVSFPANIHASAAIHEIQFGHLRRPNHGSRPYDADRFEVPQLKWSALAEENRGVAILNDSKYGISVNGNCLNLTLLKSAVAPDMTADRGTQTFTYALYAWNGSLAESNVVHEAYELNCPVLVLPGAVREPERSLFSVDAPNIILETVKPAEDGSPDVILRLYESKRMATSCVLTTALPVRAASQTDMLENDLEQLECASGKIVLEFRPFEIKTVRLKLGLGS